MRVSHGVGQVSAVFDDPNLVSCGGLAPVMALAQRCGLAGLVAGKVTLTAKGGANADVKIPALIAGMVAGADCIDDMDLLRHGGMDRLFTGVHAPSTLGTFLRTFTFGHVRQLDAVAAGLLAELAARTPLLVGAGQVTWVDVDDTIRATYGYAKQGAGFGYSGVKGTERADRDREHPAVAAGDRRDPAAVGGTRTVPGALPGWSRTRSSPPRPVARVAGPAKDWSCSAPTARSTPTT